MIETAIDFETENNHLIKEIAALRDEVAALIQKREGMAAHVECLSSTVRSLERDNAIMSAQLDIVRLIFGGES